MKRKSDGIRFSGRPIPLLLSCLLLLHSNAHVYAVTDWTGMAASTKPEAAIRIEVAGTVKDDRGEPLPGSTLSLKERRREPQPMPRGATTSAYHQETTF